MPSTLKREDQAQEYYDEKFNSHPELGGLENQAGSEFDDIKDNYDQNADSQLEDENIAKLRDKESSAPNEYNYQERDKTKGQSRGNRFKGALKRFGPTGGIVGLLVGGIMGIGIFTAPALALVHLKEVITEDLNDQAAALDIRSFHVWRAKFGNLGKTGCATTGFRCDLRSMSSRQMKNFERAGIKVETDGTRGTVTRKTPISAITFTDSNGREQRITNVNDMRSILGDRNVRNQLRRAYNPIFYSIWDKTAGKVFTKYKTSKTSRLNGSTDEERRESINNNVAGETTDLNPAPPPTSDDPEEQERIRQQQEQNESRIRDISSGPGKSVIGGALKDVAITGAADTACTVYNTARAVEAGAKVIRAAQLVRYSMIFLNTADKIKAGTATDKEVEFTMNKLTATDMREKVYSDTEGEVSGAGSNSTIQSDSKDAGITADKALINNPDYGKNAFDSQAMKSIMYNDAPSLTSRSAQYTVGGGLVGTLAGVNTTIASILGTSPAGITKKCGVVQNPYVRGGSAIIGIVAGVFSGGTTLALSIAASTALAFALPVLTAYLTEMVAGKTVDDKTEGVDAGNATASGSAVLMGDMAMERGMQPANKGQLQTYQASVRNVQGEYIAMETEDAKSTPFDIMNQYSFLGSFARKLLPVTYSSNPPMALAGLLSPHSLLPTANAIGDFNSARFSKCEDEGYEELGIDADIMCNVRYVLTPTELNMDTDSNYDWMVNEKHVDEATGEPISEEYKNFLVRCTSSGHGQGDPARGSGWGSTVDPEKDKDLGKSCIDGRSDISTPTLQHFRVYTMDRSIEQGMDDGPEVGLGAGGETTDIETGDGTELRVATFNVLGASHDDERGFKGTDKEWTKRIDRSAKVITENEFDVVGFQELEPSQSDYLVSNLSGFERTNKGKASDAIMWNSSKFSKVKEGSWESEYFGGKEDEPWVKLQDITSGQAFYVMNVHDPINNGSANASTRTANAKKHLAKVKELSADAPVVLTGDFNGGFTKDVGAGTATDEGTAYCILTKDNIMKHTYDLSVQRQAKCPNPAKNTGFNVDHIYVTPDINVASDSLRVVNGGPLNNGSDHPTVYVDVSIGGGGTGTGTSANFGSVTFPLKGTKSTVLNPEIFANNDTSMGGHDYIAYDIYAKAGTEVLAFASGTVTRVSGVGSLGNGLSVYNDEAKLVVYYTHMQTVSVKEGDTIKPGDKLGTLASVKDFPGINTDHLHIDASTDRMRQACSRGSCSIKSHFREIGKDLYNTYQALPE